MSDCNCCDVSECCDKLPEALSEISDLWELADAAVLATLTLSKEAGVELIRLRTRLGLPRSSC